MKKLFLTTALLIAAIASAQPGNGAPSGTDEALNPEKMALMQSKRLTLALDLSDKQQQQVYDLTLQQASKRKDKPSRKELQAMSKEQKQELQVQRLDALIAQKRQMKTILTEVQYEKWEKMLEQRAKKGKEKRPRMNGRRD